MNRDKAAPTPQERQALDDLFSATYEELRRLAATVRRGDRGVTLNPTALVNEAWLKLAKNPRVADTSRIHFRRIAARAMRQVLVEAARRRLAAKRGGPDVTFVSYDDGSDASGGWTHDVLDVDAALEALAELDPRQARVVECRYFGGFEIAEVAELLDISEATVQRDWRAARAWLAGRLDPAR